ncbi:MAG: hypothetical protein AB7J28_15170 [Hyphomonadaceae bacterium]
MILPQELLACRKRIFELNSQCAEGRADAQAVRTLSLDIFDFLKAHNALGIWERVHLGAAAAAMSASWTCLALSHLWLALETPEERGGASCADQRVSPARLRSMLAGA